MYGPAAIKFVQENFGKIGLAFAIVIILCGFLFFTFGRRRPSVEA
jgi:hypothetical protein